MNKRIIMIFCLIGFSTQAQQVPYYNHYLINPFVYNPAYAGASDYVNASFVRNQRFSAFGTTAINNYLTVESSIFKDKMGLGLIVAHQSQGVQQQLMSTLSYAYKLKINEDHNLRFALAGGVMDNRIDYDKLNAQDYNDPYLIGLRPTRPTFDMNVGLLYSWKDLKIGFSVPQVIGNKVKYANEKSRGYYQLARHYMLSAEYDFKVGKEFVLKPQALARYVPNAPFQYDVSFMATYHNLLWASATYKSDYAVQFNAGVHVLDLIRIGYSYELLIGKIKSYNTGMNHEIFVGFSFNRKKGKETIVEVEKIKEVEVKVYDDLAAKQRDSVQILKDELERRLKEMQAELARKQRERDSLNNIASNTKPVVKEPEPAKDTTPVKPVEKVEIPLATGYKFLELDQTDSPDGYYVIIGVFSSNTNAENVLKQSKAEYPEAHLVINEANKYYYVVILHTLEEEKAVTTFKEYKENKKEKVWILNYLKN